MTKSRDSKGRFAKLNDSLSTFTAGMAQGYRDGPYVGFGPSGYAKDWQFFYATSWIARQAVERIPEDCFRKGYSWIAEAKDVTKIEAVEKRLKIREKKKQAMVLARLDGEAYLYFDAGGSGAIDPSKPLVGEAVNRLNFVNLFSKSKISKGKSVTDPMSPYFGEPEYYEVNTASGGQQRIHPSRICRFISNQDPVTGEGRSVLMHVLSVIQAAETTRDNTVALTTQARLHIMKVCGLMDAVSDPTTEAALKSRYALARQMMETNSMLVLDKNDEDYDQRQPAYNTLPDVIETMRREVAAALEIPYALLFGRPSGLGTNGEMELATYYDNIQSMQVTDIQTACEMLDECIIRAALGDRPDDVYLEWQSLWQMSDKEKAEVAKITADTVKTLIDSGVMPAEVLTVPVVTALSEQGALPGIESAYKDWFDGGGVIDDEGDESDAPGGDLRGEP